MIQIDGLHFQYRSGSAFALSGIDLTIEKGDFVGIVGESGAGKTTLTHALTGIIPHHFSGDFYGSVKVAGMDTVEHSVDDLSALTGYVFQDIDSQMVASIVEDEILFGLENFGFPKEEIERRANTAMEMIGISDLRYRTISTLSGGQRQKVAVCAMIALQPQVLILDEPTGELDPLSSRQIFETLRMLNETYGMTILIVEQKIMLLCEYVKKLMVMSQGKAVLFGPVRQVLEEAEKLEDLGVNCPRIVTLARQLKQRGAYDGRMPVNLQEAQAMTLRALGAGGAQ